MPETDPDMQLTLEGGRPEPARTTPEVRGTPASDARTRGLGLGKAGGGTGAVLEQAGRYEVKKEYGRGGQSRVLLVVDQLMGREIALKELLPSVSAHAETAAATPHAAAALARFLREARVTAQLEHPNIVPVYELGRRADGTHYVTQKLVRGKTLREALEGCKSLAERLLLLPHLHDVCNAVAYAHSRGVIHRDLKPENVMVGEFGETVLLDWGLAQVKGRPEDPSLPPKESGPEAAAQVEIRITVEGAAVGTPQYMSPEAARGEVQAIDERSDVWGLGAMLYELLAGKAPFGGKTVREIIGQVTFGKIAPVIGVEPDAPVDLCAVAERALSRDRGRRYPDAGKLADELASYRAGGRVAAYEYGSWELVKRFVGKNRLLSGAVALAVFAVVGLFADAAIRFRAARAQLAQTLVSSARSAERDQAWARAAALFAAARLQDDRADARWGLAASIRRAAIPVLRLGNEQEAPMVALSPDGQLMATPIGTEIRLYDPHTGALRTRLRGHTRKIWSVAFDAKSRMLASGAEDGSVRLWNLDKKTQMAVVEGPSRDVRVVALSADGSLLASVGYDRVLTVRTLPSNTILATQLAARVWGIAFSPDGKLLAAGALDGAVLILDPLTGRELIRLSGHTGAVQSLAFSPDGTRLASASLDGTTRLWDVAMRDTAGRFEGFNTANASAHVAFSPDGRTLAYTARGNAVRLVDVQRARQLARLEGHGNTLLGVAFSPEGQLATAARDGTVRLWDVAPMLALGDRLEAPGGLDCASVLFVKDGKTLASGCAGRAALLWDLPSGRVRARLEHVDVPVALALSADETLLATGSLDGAVRTWDVTTGTSRQSLGPLTGAVAGVAFVRGGLSAAGRNGTLSVWDLPAGGLRFTIQVEARINGLSASPDGAQLAASLDDGTIALFESAKGTRLRVLEAHARRATDTAWSSDGRRLVSVGSDARAGLWDPATGQRLLELDGGSGLLSVAISPDDRWILTGGESVRLWDATTGELLLQREGDDPAAAVAFSPDGRSFLAGTFGGALRFVRWDDPEALAPPDEALHEILSRYRLRLGGAKMVEEQ